VARLVADLYAELLYFTSLSLLGSTVGTSFQYLLRILCESSVFDHDWCSFLAEMTSRNIRTS